MCWSHTHIQEELASRSYCGFTVQQRKAKARNAAFLWDHFAIFSFFFFPREGYNSLAYLSPRVTACTTWTRNSTWEFCITLGAEVPLKATAVSPREPHAPRPFNNHGLGIVKSHNIDSISGALNVTLSVVILAKSISGHLRWIRFHYYFSL